MKSLMRWILSVMCVAMLLSTIAFADTINVSGGGGAWNSNWTGAYWNNTGDGPGNIGYFVPSGSSFWGSGANAVSPITFSTSGAAATTYQVAYAGNADTNQLYWFDGSQSGLLFNGSTPAGTVATFTASGPFGFYLTNAAHTFYFYTDASLNPGGTAGQQHFAVFTQNPSNISTVWIGVEDLPFASADKDYNDLIFTVTAVPSSVPEPSLITLLGLGLGAIGLIGRRFKA